MADKYKRAIADLNSSSSTTKEIIFWVFIVATTGAFAIKGLKDPFQKIFHPDHGTTQTIAPQKPASF